VAAALTQPSPARRRHRSGANRVARNRITRTREALGAVWRPAQKLWEVRWADARILGIVDRVIES